MVQVSNYNLYRLGKRKSLPECMVAVKFEPMDNWLPPGYIIRTNDSSMRTDPISSTDPIPDLAGSTANEPLEPGSDDLTQQQRRFTQEVEECEPPLEEELGAAGGGAGGSGASKILIPFNLQTQHSLPDKSVADCVEALIGCYLSTCGQRAALLFMAWLGLKVLSPSCLPQTGAVGRGEGAERGGEDTCETRTDKCEGVEKPSEALMSSYVEPDELHCEKEICVLSEGRSSTCVDARSDADSGSHVADASQSLEATQLDGTPTANKASVSTVPCEQRQVVAASHRPHGKELDGEGEEGHIPVLISPLLKHVEGAHALLEFYLDGYDAFERRIEYHFRDRSYLLQAFTHASYHYNTITDCYQR